LIGRHLVDEAFDGEGVEYVPGRAPVLETPRRSIAWLGTP
jgi:hypothetical protein